MLASLRVRPQIRARLSGGPLSEHVEAFVAVLRDEGYAPGVIRRYIHAVDVFGRWLTQRRIPAKDVDGVIVARFVSSLRRTRSRGRPHGRSPDVASGVRKFATLLWATGVAIRHRASPETEIERWLRVFDEYLARVGGASAGTRRIYRRYAWAFLTARFGSASLDWSAVTTDDITEFVRVHAAALSPAANRAPATAIRTFLRFLTALGVARSGLDEAIPPVRSWKLAGLPRTLTPDELQRVFTACDRTPTAATRDRVVLLLLARLGLRASEVAALRIDDIDWHEGEIGRAHV